jgi:hypothetical protein
MLTTPAQIRSTLIDTLQLDLIGPTIDDTTHHAETIPQAPAKWYLSGFLVPYEAKLSQRSDPDSDDQPDQQPKKAKSNDDDNPPEPETTRKGIFPSSCGLSFLVTAQTEYLDLNITWGSYTPITDASSAIETGLQARTSIPWKRHQNQVPMVVSLQPNGKTTEQISLLPDTDDEQINLPLHTGFRKTLAVLGHNGLEIVISVRPIDHNCGLEIGTRSVSLFLVNNQAPQKEDANRDCAYIFQAQLTVQSKVSFVPRPDLRKQAIDDEDEHIADLQYRDVVEYAVGHNVSATALITADIAGKQQCHEIRTEWMPQADVEKVVASDIPDVNLEISALGNASDAESVRKMIGGIVIAYTNWISQQRLQSPTTPKNRADFASELLDRAAKVNQRINDGLQALDDPDVLEAFKIANRAIDTAIRQRSIHGKENALPEDLAAPKWRPFQLAFLLMNIVGIANPEHGDRNIVDLLFFPTGGGKTEAYLGLAAFTLVLRRLRNPGLESAGLSVLMRYTLRLLTLDQLGRASTLICALELERQQNIEKLGPWPFEIGLWVGQTATANRMGRKGESDKHTARARTIACKTGSSSEWPIPIENCPWCGTKFDPIKSFQLLPSNDAPTDLRITCTNRKNRPDGKPACVFRRNQALPIITVDEPIYRRLPCFIIATVDKFANLPWVGETGGLFGKVQRYDNDGFYGPATPSRGGNLTKPLFPPDLIIQDELHLISGPLGTMVGLYETAIESLSSYDRNGQTILPKIIASTATVRRANSQIRALFGRDQVEIFPPPGPDRRDSFFAKTVPTSERHGRTYIGIAAQGRSLKVVLLRTYLALLGASQKAWLEAGGKGNPENPADPYMTLMGYFNSLRELGGSRRIVDDEVKSRLEDYGNRKRDGEDAGLFVKRTITESLELTSRVNTTQIAEAKARLETTFHTHEQNAKAAHVVLATNMISVGLDITRLGLMVVLGQPKTASEYIQATSRVGRDDNRPGLVVTLLNIHRPRDRSHYERFQAWHNTFYRAVEATSVTPFSPRALDRGLAAVTVALARLGHDSLTAPLGAGAITQHRQALDYVSEILSERAARHDKELDAESAEALRVKVQGLVKDLLDSWSKIADTQEGKLQYQKEVGMAPPLLFSPLDPELVKQPQIAQKFKAQRSLRDVEPTVDLWIKMPNIYDTEAN